MLTPDRSAVELQLQRILQSPRFAASERLSAFLRFIVDAALRGDPGSAKEVVIAGEVYGRGMEYDPQVDSTVRADASRLRARLREFYSAAGVDDPVLIEIPKGTYLPVFTLRTAAPEKSEHPDVNANSGPQRQPARRRALWAAGVLILMAAGILAAAWAYTAKRSRDTANAAAEIEMRARQLIPTVGDHLLRASQPEPEYPLDKLLLAAGNFETSVKIDPTRTSAWTGMTQTYLLAALFDRRYVLRAQEAADQAVKLEPGFPDAQFLKAYIQFFEGWDFQGAAKGFLRTIQLQPKWEAAYRHYGDAATLTGQTDQADRVIEAGLRLFPRSTLLLLTQAMLRYHQHRYDDMLAVAEQLPQELDLASWVRGLAREQKGDFAEAERELKRCLATSPRNNRCAIAMVHLLARMGRVAEAETRAAGLSDGENELTIARVFQSAGLRNDTQTVEWIRRGIAQHDYSIPYLLVDPRFDHLRKDPEFVTEMRRISAQL